MTPSYVSSFSLEQDQRLYLGKLGWNLALEKDDFTEMFRLMVFAAEMMQEIPAMQAAVFVAAVSAGKFTLAQLFLLLVVVTALVW